MKRFLSETKDGDIREKLYTILTIDTELCLRASFVKAMLGLL